MIERRSQYPKLNFGQPRRLDLRVYGGIRYAARKGSLELPAVGRLDEPDEAGVWPPLERVPDDFEARWKGEK